MLALATAMPALAQENPPFRFEDYKERTAFTEAVITRFPLGSSYLAFKRQVIAAGAKSGQNILNEPENTHVFRKTERPGVATMIVNQWTITVTVDGDTLTAVSPSFIVTSNPGSDE